MLILFLNICFSAPSTNPEQNTSVAGTTGSPTQKCFNKKLQEKWKIFDEKFVSKIKEFQKNLKNEDVQTVFYPFGGADIVFPMCLFPNASNYVLVGLERIGSIEQINNDINYRYINNLLEDFFKVGYFITSHISGQVTKKGGMLPVLIMLLTRLEMPILNIEYFNIKNLKGVCVECGSLEKPKKIYYLRGDLSNDQLDVEALLDLKIDATLIKAASYLLHHKDFIKLRDFILNSSKYILQDDTGVPVKFLQKKFNINLYGKYKKACPKVFLRHTQSALKKLYDSADTEAVGFRMGYSRNSAIIEAMKR